MKCSQCGKESETGADMKILSCDGDFICDNGICEKEWNKWCSGINTMSDTQFESYIYGESK